ncbi:MAG TPA: AmmeMemoRadiSam system protein A [Terriglobales bacterium]|nr:AmmeMemoRadiSam system protein A [Terriglobales bacterium]
MSRLFESPSEKPSASLTTREVTRDATTPAAEFSPEQRRILLRIAHGAILSALERRPFPEAPPLSPGLSDPRGVFTTLYLHNDVHGDLHRQLRGCVGYAVPIAPLFRAVAETARAAAFEDSRFLPVTMEEALHLEVSLSVLSRLFPIDLEAVEVGRHGLVISEGARRGLLLPQVAVENGWNRETFLEQTCRKAGLPRGAWRKNATIEAFTAEIFADADAEIPC